MTDKFQNKYRIPSARLQTWDYRWGGAYFITICTKNRIHYFGEIVNSKMKLSNVRILADVFWHEIKNHSTNITMGEFVVMPNHIHGILIINPPPDVKTRLALSLRDTDCNENTDKNVNPNGNTDKNPQKSIGQNRLQNPGKIPYPPLLVAINLP